MNDDIYLIWLNRIEGIGIKKIKCLLNDFSCAKDVFYAKRVDLMGTIAISETNINRIISSQNEQLLEKYQTELDKLRIKYISINNNKYPKLLKKISDAPIGLYLEGELPDDDLTYISIVGSRRCTEYGLSVANNIAKGLACNDVVVVSGMARGIDTQAHRGAVDVNGYTIAILGCGLDVCYPPENRDLKARILEKGCVISEFPPGTSPMPTNFPMRNRIISGISVGVVVVEASQRSGTLITVGQALEQGRDVFAVPGNITSKLSVGTNKLIKDGALLVSNYKDILDELKIEIKINNKKMEKNNSNLLAQEEKLVYDCISFEPIDIESLVDLTKSELSTLQYILTMLEIKSFIKKISGQRYIRN